MGANDKHSEEIEAYEENMIENLTVNDAFILIAVCAAKEETAADNNQIDNTKRIAAWAHDHPIELTHKLGICHVACQYIVF